MGITIMTVELRRELEQIGDRRARLGAEERARVDGRLRSGPNTLAWFLDDLAARLAPTLPEHIFSQAVGPPPGPGDLDPERCRLLATALRRAALSDVSACSARALGYPGAGLRLAREIAELLDRAVVEAGIAVR